ncbi:MAG: alpha/beta hydrolase [Acidobacteria bacterium]|nr:alpha/beta hydrolase [Acidobacteriota bacterium]
MLLHLPGPAGRLEALLDEPEGDPRAAVVFAHPHPLHGGSMHTKVVFRATKALAGIGCAVVRFNFRGVGTSEGIFAEGIGEADDFRAVTTFLAERYPGLEAWAAGFSFGSWVALTVGAADDRVSRLIGIGTPVASYDFSAVRDSPKPKFLIHAERDELTTLRAVRAFYARLSEPKELVVIDAADHLFDGKASEVGDAIEDLLADSTPEGLGRT